MNKLTFRAVMDDGSYIHWEDGIELPDGTVKRASVDDIDRDLLSNLLTLNEKMEPVHAIGFPKPERPYKKAVWRLTRRLNTETGEVTTVGALAGWNQLFKDGHTELKLDFVNADTGEAESAEGIECQLHPREVFTREESEALQAEQVRQNRITEEDNEMLANPVTEETITEDDGNNL